MSIETIDDLSDPRLAAFADVREPDLVRRRNLFVAESLFVVQTLLSRSRYQARALLLTEAAQASLEPELSNLGADVPVFVAPRATIKEVVGFPFHQGCLALGERPVPPTAAELLAGLGMARRVVVLEGVSNPDNVGAVFRNALAFGADAVLLDGRSVDPLYRKAIRSSMAASLRLPFSIDAEITASLAAVADAGLRRVALTPAAAARDLRTWAAEQGGRPTALLLGNEGHGLSAAARELADVEVRIPIAAAVDSLNVNAAAGIALYELSRATAP